MRPLFGHAPRVEHHYLVGVAHGRETVRDHEHRAPARELRERLLDPGLVLGIGERRRTTTSASFKMARASMRRCTSPPER